jgi:hypothetical protein
LLCNCNFVSPPTPPSFHWTTPKIKNFFRRVVFFVKIYILETHIFSKI